MADASLVGNIIVRDHASKALKQIGDETKKTHGKFKDFAAGLAGGALAAGLVGAFKTGLDEVKDYQAGLAQAKQVIASTGGAAGVSAQHIEDLASQIQNYSGQTDDSIVAGQNLLLTFTGIKNAAGAGNDIFDQTTKIMADMSQAMGQDTKTSAIQLGKALNDPIHGVSALQRAGVSFSDAQKTTIKRLQETGDTVGAQKIILAELTKEFGGSAKAFGESGPGQIAKAKRSFEDLSQSLVTNLAPAVDGLAKGLNDVIGFVQKNSSVIVPLIGVVGGLAVAVWGINTAVAAWQATEKAAMAVKALFITTTNAETGAVERGALAQVGAAVKQGAAWAASGAQSVAAALASAAAWVASGARTVASFVASTAAMVAQQVAMVASSVAAKALAAAQWLVNAAMEANPIGLVVAAIAALAAGLIYAYKHSETFRSIVNGAFHAVSDAASFMWNDVLKPTFKFIVDAWLAVAGAIVHGAASAFGWVPGIGGKLKSAAKEFDSFRDQVNASLDGVKKNVHVQVSADFTAYGANALGVATNAAAHGRASGGPVRAGMPYIVGEHEPELFVPAQSGTVLNGRQMAGLGGGTHITVNVAGSVASENDLAEAIQNALLRKKQRGGVLGLA